MKNKLTLFTSLLSTVLLTAAFCFTANAQSTTPRVFEDRFVLQSVRLIHGAQMTYQATAGAGTYGTLTELRQADLIDAALANGDKYGYIWVLSRTHRTATMPARFILTATPRLYPKSGRKSFYIDERGEIRGADKRGATANADDPLVDDCAMYGSLDNERCQYSICERFMARK